MNTKRILFTNYLRIKLLNYCLTYSLSDSYHSKLMPNTSQEKEDVLPNIETNAENGG